MKVRYERGSSYLYAIGLPIKFAEFIKLILKLSHDSRLSTQEKKVLKDFTDGLPDEIKGDTHGK